MPEQFLKNLPGQIINAAGYSTRVGGSCPSAEVLQAMQWAQGRYFEMDDLLEHASSVIARVTGSEAGIVTCGAGAGLTLAAAAILAGDDLEIMEALPDASRLQRRTFLYPEANYFDYDHPVRAAGARLRFFSFASEGLEERLQAAFSDDLAGVIHVWKHRHDNAIIRRVAAVCRKAGVPFLLDGAMCLPPHENLQQIASLGANLVVLSGGKHLEGPQNSGLLFGDAELIRSAWLQMVDMHVRPSAWSQGRLLDILPRPPRHGIGRGFKIGKDTVLGCLTALERYASRDFAAEKTRWHSVCKSIADALRGISSFDVEYLQENGTGQYPVVKITAANAENMRRLQHGLKTPHPKIILAEDDDNAAVSYIYPMCLNDREADALIERITLLLKHAN